MNLVLMDLLPGSDPILLNCWLLDLPGTGIGWLMLLALISPLVNVGDCWFQWIVWGRSEAMYLAAEGKLIRWAADCCISLIALCGIWLAFIDNGGTWSCSGGLLWCSYVMMLIG
ncbi:hypothetical protein Nepgr_022919 [Nepenthes gracilis]|uniref:Uncharacterized protein n=1 Tax=Nepenthes gracilis TaxID=150966 RepID=A0AAD3T2Y1_NEPGR|nr:hypothetical protein Nepgr_022919 [Nepenthes gracilis]